MRSLVIHLHLDLSPSALASEQWHLLRCSLPGQYLLKPMQVVSSRPQNLKLYYFRDRHISNPRDIQNNCRCRRPMPAMDPTAFVQQRSDGSMPLQSCLWQIHSSTKEAVTSYNDEFQTRSSGNEVRDEILKCYELVERLGRGAVYLGSARVEPDHAHFAQAIELGREVALLLNCTSWTGVGPGLMDAALKGALQAGKPVGGFKINNEGGKWMNSFRHPYLVAGTYLTCRFFSARKHGLVDAGVRSSLCDHTAFIALPGGIGTLDEAFEILTLIQLDRIGSKYPVPFLLMNYDGYYNHLISFLQTCEVRGTISDGEIDLLWRVCRNNSEALEYLADFYGINENERNFRETLQKI